jgi:glucose/arabinose dehydrogenase
MQTTIRSSVPTRAYTAFGAFNQPLLLLFVVALSLVQGCATYPVLVPTEHQKTIDRSLVEYPTGYELKPYIRNLTAPTAIAFDNEGSLIVAEGGLGGYSPRLFGYKPDGTEFTIYPRERRIPFVKSPFAIYGPIGGMVVVQGKVFVSHRDANGKGAITAFGYDGSHNTVVADLPAEGDYSVTDLAINPNGRLYFGVGAATNSSVVGLDNWATGWVRDYPKFCDQPWVDLKLLGYRFDTRNPIAGLFSGEDTAVSAPFQPFGTSNKLRVPHAANGKPTAAVYSVNSTGGGLRVEAHGVRYPAGLAFNEYGRLYMTNQGMELRGTRPVKDDPNTVLWVVRETWYGWPDYSSDLQPITDSRFQPPAEMIIKTGYPELSFVIDHEGSGLIRPDRSTLLRATLPPLSGASKMDFVPSSGPFKAFHGSAIVALSGDRAPFATNGAKNFLGPVGYKLVRVDVDNKQVRDFIRNTQGLPASRLPGHPEALERPVDIKFGPDGAMYILDMGQLEMKDGEESVTKGSGRVFRLMGTGE